MCGNTRPKLLKRLTMGEHYNNGFLTMSSPDIFRSALYGVPLKLRTRTPWWFPDPRCWTSDRQPTSSGPTTWRYAGDRRRRRRTKTETAEDRDRLTLGTSESPDDTPEWTQCLILLLCDPLTPEPVKVAAVSAAPGPVVEPPYPSRS